MADTRGGQYQTSINDPRGPFASSQSHFGSRRPDSTPMSRQLVKAATAITAGGSLLLLSGLTLTGTVIGLTIATPLLVIFSPVLVPAAITLAILFAGFITSGGFGVAAITVFSWIYRYVSGKRPVGADTVDEAKSRLAGKAREMKDKADQYGQTHGGSYGQTYGSGTTYGQHA